MSGTVRVFAVASALAVAALLNFVLRFAWYMALPAGVIILIVLPICAEFISSSRREYRLRGVVVRERERVEREGPDHKGAGPDNLPLP